MSAPEIIRDLVDRFHRNSDSYRSPVYNETQTRLEFINPMFKALGWDMDNEQGYAEAYKDVIHEDAIKIEGATKAPDYCFRVGGTRKFFLEAKKPAINLAQDEGAAFQLRRYAWSAKLPVSILTDFEEFIVYDCRLRPSVNDKTSKARVISLQYRDYIDKWSEIASIFSREAVLKGSFDKFAETALRKRGTAEVDEEFLAEIEMWRESLARNISLRNRTLTARELNYAVQLTIDRLIFLRICEDRRIESYGRLKQAATGSNVYKNLFQLFHQADQRYNSGLFHFEREKDRPSDIDSLTPNIRVDDKPLRDIIKRLYYPESPYEFSVLPADILGHIYEQFLGKVITLTKGHQAKIEEKPEVRKAGGVYYTPTYIVNYIVKNTVGELLKGKTAGVKGTATKLRVLDPACGSGSFLLGAYQFLLDWHLEQYLKDDPQKLARGTNATIFQDKRGEWRLTTSERKRILLNNIYGVDIDSQAVEVTKLSLLLKVLEEESSETLEKNLKLFHERALPDLGDNIKCGNSLIAPDFYSGWQSDLFDEEEKYRVNVFDWKSEFKSILKDGGFDAIIGNPPWGYSFTENDLVYLRNRNRPIIVRMIDSFMFFVYHTSQLLKQSGSWGMIVPDVLLYQTDNERLRMYLLESFTLRRILNMGNVFHKVTRPAAIVVFENSKSQSGGASIVDISDLSKSEKPMAILDDSLFQHTPQSRFLTIPGKVISSTDIAKYQLWEKVNSISNRPLSDYVDKDDIQRGVSPDLQEAFIVSLQKAEEQQLESDKLRPVLTGGIHVKRYFIEEPELFLIYTTRSDDFSKIPHIRRWIDKFKDQIKCKEVAEGKHSVYALHRPRDPMIFAKSPKFVGVITADRPILALNANGVAVTDGLFVFGLKSELEIPLILGVLNSKLMSFIYRLLALERGRVLAQVKPAILKTLPICQVGADNDKIACRDRLIECVRDIGGLTVRHSQARAEHDRIGLRRRIEELERVIDAMVYSLYNLTEKEIAEVEREI